MTKITITISALFLGILGITFSFLPQETFAFFNEPSKVLDILALKILGATLMSLAAINWMSKDRLMGGIYNRPLALANVLHFCVGAVTFAKTLYNGQAGGSLIMIIMFIYSIFAVLFLKIMFTTPKEVTQ